jgi:hypothetical protein
MANEDDLQYKMAKYEKLRNSELIDEMFETKVNTVVVT